MDMIVPFIIWIMIGVATAYFAHKRGRDPLIWFMIGTLLGILGLIILFILPASKTSNDHPSEDLGDVLPPVLPEVEVDEVESPVLQKHWFYVDQTKQQQGPISFILLKQDWEANKISDQTYVWSEGMVEWQHIADLPELKETLNVR